MTDTTKLLLCRAEQADIDLVRRFLAESAMWMHRRGNTAWPKEGFPRERIRPGIEAGEVWLLRDGIEAVATITLDQRPEAEFEAPEAVQAGVTAMLPHAWIGHRLASDRSLPGRRYGELLVQWSIDWTYRRGGRWRLTNVARTATALQDWYRKELGFQHAATVTSTRTTDGQPRKSGYLMTRQVSLFPAVYDRLREGD